MKKLFTIVADRISCFMGTANAFIGGLLIVILWLCAGPFFHWSEVHGLFINTLTTIITFLTVFLIQHSQNKDTKAIQLKLDQLIKSQKEAKDEFIGIETLADEKIEELRQKL